MHLPTVIKSSHLAGVKLCLGGEKLLNLCEIMEKIVSIYCYIKNAYSAKCSV